MCAADLGYEPTRSKVPLSVSHIQAILQLGAQFLCRPRWTRRHSSRCGSRDIEHLSSAYNNTELAALKAAARQRLARRAR